MHKTLYVSFKSYNFIPYCHVMMQKCEQLIDKLKLIPHPEGGHFVETFRDNKDQISHIFYLLKNGEKSHWHKINKNELLIFYDGDPLQILLSKDKIHTKKIILGKDLDSGQKYHFIVKEETWFSMIPLDKWSLIGCIVVPAFNYHDLELAPPNWSPGK